MLTLRIIVEELLARVRMAPGWGSKMPDWIQVLSLPGNKSSNNMKRSIFCGLCVFLSHPHFFYYLPQDAILPLCMAQGHVAGFALE